jgi:hypothetical protein
VAEIIPFPHSASPSDLSDFAEVSGAFAAGELLRGKEKRGGELPGGHLEGPYELGDVLESDSDATDGLMKLFCADLDQLAFDDTTVEFFDGTSALDSTSSSSMSGPRDAQDMTQLGLMGETTVAMLLDALDHGDDAVCQRAIALLPVLRHRGLGPAEMEPVEAALMGRLFDTAVPIARRENLAAAVAALFGRFVHNPLLFEKLTSHDEDDVVVAAMALGFPGNGAALKPLEVLLSHASVRVQEAAIFGLSGLKDGRLDDAIVETLVGALDRAFSDRVRLTLLANLKLFSNEDLEDVFIEHVGHKVLDIRLAGLSGLFFVCSEAGRTAAVESLNAAESRVRAMALAVLERHGKRADLEAVFGVLADADDRVRTLAREVAAALRKR